MSDLGYALGRLLLAPFFILSGYANFADVTGVAAMLTRAGVPQPRLVGYAVAAVELIGEIMLLVGFKGRWAALALCLLSAGTIYVGHNFWTMEGAEYAANRTHALKNLAIMGGLLLIAVGGSGRFSFDGRGR